MNTRSATLNSSLTTPWPIATKIEKEVTVKKRQRYIWPEAQFVRLMHRFRCEVRVAYQNRVDFTPATYTWGPKSRAIVAS